MQRNNMYLYEALRLINTLGDTFSIKVNEENKYYSILRGLTEVLSEYKEEDIVIKNSSIVNDIKDFIISLDIKNLSGKLRRFSKVSKDIKEDDRERSLELKDLSNVELLRFLLKLFKGITFVQKENLLLVKYNKSGLFFGYNNLYNCTRGKVLDLNTLNIVSYPFDKFFNLNEEKETNIDRVLELLSRARYTSVMDKLDGSLISVTKYNEDLLITTNGALDNEFIKIAKDMINKKYPKLKKYCMPKHTYIFELIHPYSRVIVDYGEREELILVGIRDLNTNKLFKYEDVYREANRLNLNVVEVYENEDIKTLLLNGTALNIPNKEGWVLRIITDTEDIMVKLKLDEYADMHKFVLTNISPATIFDMMQKDMFDDAISKIKNPCNKELALKVYEDILLVFSLIEESLTKNINDLTKKFDVNRENMITSLKSIKDSDLLNKRIVLVNYIHSNLKDYYDKEGSMKYFIEGMEVDEIIKGITKKEFRRICDRHRFNIFN